MSLKEANKSVRRRHASCTPASDHAAELLHIHRQSAYLIGRDKTVVDIAVDHPSCSKQHAVIQCTQTLLLVCFIKSKPLLSDRHVQQKDEYGVSKGAIK